jgi:PAS domain S-box-containing protein
VNIHSGIPSIYQAILESMGEGIIFADAEGILVFINSTAENIRGISAADFIGRSLLSIHSPASAERIGKLLESLKNGSIRLSRRVIEVNGKFFENSYHPIRQPDGFYLGTLLVSRDITEKHRLKEENQTLRKNMNIGALFDGFAGTGTAMAMVFRTISVVAPLNSTTLITGESGTGKELVATAIHKNSKRCLKLMVTVNCAALPENMIESELFGYRRGAFTGAVASHRGKFEQADGGTIFLDEIGDLPANAQAKLLRVLQNKVVVRLGSEKQVKVDVRIIAATNQDLKKLVAQGCFREDLFYRLNVITIQVPPLRERREDIIPLAEFFVSKFAKSMDKPVMGISEGTRSLLLSHDYPGNVRELENAIERSVALGSGADIAPQDLPADFVAAGNNSDHHIHPGRALEIKTNDLSHARGDFEHQVILDALVRTNGRKADAAKLLNISRKTLWQKMKLVEKK